MNNLKFTIIAMKCFNIGVDEVGLPSKMIWEIPIVKI